MSLYAWLSLCVWRSERMACIKNSWSPITDTPWLCVSRKAFLTMFLLLSGICRTTWCGVLVWTWWWAWAKFTETQGKLSARYTTIAQGLTWSVVKHRTQYSGRWQLDINMKNWILQSRTYFVRTFTFSKKSGLTQFKCMFLWMYSTVSSLPMEKAHDGNFIGFTGDVKFVQCPADPFCGMDSFVASS